MYFLICSLLDLFHYGTGEGSQGSNTQLLSVCPGGGWGGERGLLKNTTMYLDYGIQGNV